MNGTFYVYIIFDLNGTPRYVGKGKGDRWLYHESRTRFHNPFLKGLVSSAKQAGRELPKIKLCEHLTEREAWQLEVILIAAIGRRNIGLGPLANLSDGGDGPAGMRFPESAKETLSAVLSGRKLTDAHKAKIRKGLRRIGFVPRTDHLVAYNELNTKGKPKQWKGRSRDSFVAKQLGRVPGNRKGKRASEDTRRKIREAKARQAPIPQEARDRAGLKNRGNTVARGRIWITNGVENKMVYPDQIFPGWRRGQFRTARS